MIALRLQRVLWIGAATAAVAALLSSFVLDEPWWSRDQQGTRRYRDEEFDAAAELFMDPAWQAAALYRAGRFEEAGLQWSSLAGAEASFNAGNALVFQGRYEEAVARYESALEQRPNWAEAQRNRDIAESRIAGPAKLGEATEVGADDVVFDPNVKKSGGDSVEVTGGEALPDKAMRALWLRNVKTEPADFLRAKFAYQHAIEQAGPAPEGESR